MDNTLHINGYKTIHTPAVSTSHGRKKGGLCIYVSHRVNVKKLEFTTSNIYYQVLKLYIDNLHCTAQLNFYYNFPKEQAKVVLRHLQKEMHTMQMEINKDICVIWGGDFNIA